MGFRIAWLAFSGKSKNDVLASLRAVDTNEPDEANEAPMSVASLPGDWTIVWLNRFDHPFAEDASLHLFSRGCMLMAVHVHEGTMFSAVQMYQNCKRQWAVFRDFQAGEFHLEVLGNPPAKFADIANRQTKFHREDSKASGIDYMFEIPLELAESLCGFRHDLTRYDWGGPKFTELRDRSEMQ